MTARKPSQQDEAEFAGFCRQATNRQLIAIIEREGNARRHRYADIARRELESRKEGMDVPR